MEAEVEVAAPVAPDVVVVAKSAPSRGYRGVVVMVVGGVALAGVLILAGWLVFGT